MTRLTGTTAPPAREREDPERPEESEEHSSSNRDGHHPPPLYVWTSIACRLARDNTPIAKLRPGTSVDASSALTITALGRSRSKLPPADIRDLHP